MDRYQSQNITLVRNAKEGDVGFDAEDTSGDQVLICMPDNSKRVIKRSEIEHT